MYFAGKESSSSREETFSMFKKLYLWRYRAVCAFHVYIFSPKYDDNDTYTKSCYSFQAGETGEMKKKREIAGCLEEHVWSVYTDGGIDRHVFSWLLFFFSLPLFHSPVGLLLPLS